MAIFALKLLRPSNAAANLLVTKVAAKRWCGVSEIASNKGIVKASPLMREGWVG